MIDLSIFKRSIRDMKMSNFAMKTQNTYGRNFKVIVYKENIILFLQASLQVYTFFVNVMDLEF